MSANPMFPQAPTPNPDAGMLGLGSDPNSPFAAVNNTPTSPAGTPSPSAVRQEAAPFFLQGPQFPVGPPPLASARGNPIMPSPPPAAPTPAANPDAGLLAMGGSPSAPMVSPDIAPSAPPVDVSNEPGPFAMGEQAGPQSSTFDQGPGSAQALPESSLAPITPPDDSNLDPNSGIRWSPQIQMYRTHADEIRKAAQQLQVPAKPGMNWIQALVGIAGAIAANGNPKNNFVPQYMQGLAQENERIYGNTMEAFQKTRQDMLQDAQVLESRANGIQQSQEAIYKAQQGVYGSENKGIGAAKINAASKLTLQQAALKNKLDLTDRKIAGDLAKAQSMVDSLKARDLNKQDTDLFRFLINPNATEGAKAIFMARLQENHPGTFGSVAPNVLQAAIDQSGALANLANERAETQNQVRDMYSAMANKYVQDGKLDQAHVGLLTKQLSLLDPEFQLKGAQVLGDLMLRTKELQIKGQVANQGKGDPNAVIQNEVKALEGAAALYKAQVGAILARNSGKEPAPDSDDYTPYQVALGQVNTIAKRLHGIGTAQNPAAAVKQVPDVFGDDPATAAIQQAEAALGKPSTPLVRGGSTAPIPGTTKSDGLSHLVPREGDAFEVAQLGLAQGVAAKWMADKTPRGAKALAAIWNHYNQIIGQHRQGQ